MGSSSSRNSIWGQGLQDSSKYLEQAAHLSLYLLALFILLDVSLEVGIAFFHVLQLGGIPIHALIIQNFRMTAYNFGNNTPPSSIYIPYPLR